MLGRRRSVAFPTVVTEIVARRLADLGIDADESLAGFLASTLNTTPDDYRVASMIVDGMEARRREVARRRVRDRGPRLVSWE